MTSSSVPRPNALNVGVLGKLVDYVFIRRFSLHVKSINVGIQIIFAFILHVEVDIQHPNANRLEIIVNKSDGLHPVDEFYLHVLNGIDLHDALQQNQRYRPWAEKGAQISTNATTFNREILIVEKERDNKPFNLHTSYEDQIAYYGSLRNPWLFVFLSTLLLAIINTSYICGSLTILSLLPVIMYQAQIYNQKKELKIKEW